MELFRLIVIRPDEPAHNRKKTIRGGLSKAEANAEKENWSQVFNSDVYMDPVPVLRVEPDTQGDPND